MMMRVGNVSETDTSYTFTVNGAFKYWGYMNLVFAEFGYYVVNKSSVIVSQNHTSTYLTTENGGAQMTNEGMWVQDCTYTVAKPTYEAALIPYFMLGLMDHYTADLNPGDAWWWGNGYGVLTAWGSTTSATDVEINAAHYVQYGLNATFDGNTRAIHGARVTGTTNTGNNLSYDQALIKLSSPPPVYVYDGGTWHQGKNVYVFNGTSWVESRSLAVWNSSGSPVVKNW